MSMSLRKAARLYPDLWSYLVAFGSPTLAERHGCSGARELARVWYRVHPTA